MAVRLNSSTDSITPRLSTSRRKPSICRSSVTRSSSRPPSIVNVELGKPVFVTIGGRQALLQ